MQAIELIRQTLQMADEGTRQIVWDMSDAPLVQPVQRDGQGSGNHPLWILGHLAFIEGSVATAILGEDVRNPVEHWASLFAPGTEPKPDASLYPSFDEVLGAYRDMRARTLKLLDQIGEEGLDRAPKAVPPGFEESMRTVGQALMLLALHQMVHYGQITDARRAAGRKPLL